MVVYVCFLAAPLARCLCRRAAWSSCGRCLLLPLLLGGDEVVHLDIALFYAFFLQAFVLLVLRLALFLALLGAILFGLLLVGIFVIHAVVKVLVVQLLVVAIELTNAWVEPDHHVFVLHESRCLLDDLVGCLVASLRVEWAKDDAAGRIILHQAVLVRLNAALCELSVEVVGSP